MIIRVLIAVVLAVPAYFYTMRYNIHMFQQNGYKNKEHLHWLKRPMEQAMASPFSSGWVILMSMYRKVTIMSTQWGRMPDEAFMLLWDCKKSRPCKVEFCMYYNRRQSGLLMDTAIRVGAFSLRQSGKLICLWHFSFDIFDSHSCRRP